MSQATQHTTAAPQAAQEALYNNLRAFKAYDLRGTWGEDIDETLMARTVFELLQLTGAKRVAIGHDVRKESAALAKTAKTVLTGHATHVHDLGLCTTDALYFALMQEPALELSLAFTASHNPLGDAGLKITLKGGKAFSTEQIQTLKARVATTLGQPLPEGNMQTQLTAAQNTQAYAAWLAKQVDITKLKGKRILLNAADGVGGPLITALAAHLPEGVCQLMGEIPNPAFPDGVSNPIAPAQWPKMSAAVQEAKADFGVMFDGDADRCGLFDEDGAFVNGYYVNALLTHILLEKAQTPGHKIIGEPRLFWLLEDICTQHGAQFERSRVGHTFIKQALRNHDALFGGEAACHFFFRDFVSCDNAQLPWLLIAEHLTETSQTLKQAVAAYQAAYPTLPEKNWRLTESTQVVLARVEQTLSDEALHVDHLDGLSMTFENWRFNLRASNTEPLVRLNLETRSNETLLHEMQSRLGELINASA